MTKTLPPLTDAAVVVKLNMAGTAQGLQTQHVLINAEMGLLPKVQRIVMIITRFRGMDVALIARLKQCGVVLENLQFVRITQ